MLSCPGTIRGEYRFLPEHIELGNNKRPLKLNSIATRIKNFFFRNESSGFYISTRTAAQLKITKKVETEKLFPNYILLKKSRCHFCNSLMLSTSTLLSNSRGCTSSGISESAVFSFASARRQGDAVPSPYYVQYQGKWANFHLDSVMPKGHLQRTGGKEIAR